MKMIIEFIKGLLDLSETDDFNECPALGSNNCQYCPKLNECVKYFKDK